MCRIVQCVACFLPILLQSACGVAATGKREQADAGKGDGSFWHQMFPRLNGDPGRMVQSPPKSIRWQVGGTADDGRNHFRIAPAGFNADQNSVPGDVQICRHRPQRLDCNDCGTVSIDR